MPGHQCVIKAERNVLFASTYSLQCKFTIYHIVSWSHKQYIRKPRVTLYILFDFRLQHPMQPGWTLPGAGQDTVSPLNMPNAASPMFSPQLSPRTPSPFATTTPPGGMHVQPVAVAPPTHQEAQPVKPQLPARGTDKT